MPIKRTRTRHAPDGSVVPMDSLKGLTIHEKLSFRWPKNGVTPRAIEEFERFLGIKRRTDGTMRSDRLGDLLESIVRQMTSKLRQQGINPREQGRVHAARTGSPYTASWFAAEILWTATRVQRDVDRNEAASAARNAFHLASTIALVNFKYGPEADAIEGIKVAAGRKKTSESIARRKSGHHELIRRMDRELEAKGEGWDKKEARVTEIVARLKEPRTRAFEGLSGALREAARDVKGSLRASESKVYRALRKSDSSHCQTARLNNGSTR